MSTATISRRLPHLNLEQAVAWLLAHANDCKSQHGDPPTPKHQAAHSCGNGHLGCVASAHLSWKTKIENEADKILHGTTNRGERQGRSKLKQDDVRRIRGLLALGKRPVEIAMAYEVTPTLIRQIRERRVWAWMD